LGLDNPNSTNSRRIAGILKCRALLSDEPPQLHEAYEAALAELGSLGRGLPIWAPTGYGTFDATPTLIRRRSRKQFEKDSFLAPIIAMGFESRFTDALFVLDVQYTFDVDEVDVSDDMARSYYLKTATELVENTLRTLVYASNIALPGSLDSTSIEIIVSDESVVLSSERLVADLWSVREYAAKTGWPHLKKLSVIETWGWLLGNLLPARSGDSALSRAFNAYTYLFASDLPEPLQLITSLTGIESLFGSGRPGIATQIVERAQLLLGKRESFKHDLREMYDARSAIVHGGFGFPPLHFPFDDPAAYETRRKKLSRAEDVAAAVLVAALQTLASRKANQLAFTESLATSNVEYDQERSEEVGYHFRLYAKADMDAYMDARLPPDVDDAPAI
jgi:hypothetical protein